MSIKFGDKDYALVPDRLKEFRETNPRASVETEPTYNADGSVTFKATIVRDRADEYSATATGNARYSEVEMEKPKAFEKLETVSVGRALSMLGYLNDGRIASTEEMDEFEQYKEDKLFDAIEAVKSAKSKVELIEIQSKLSASDQLQLNSHIRDRVKELQNATAK